MDILVPYKALYNNFNFTSEAALRCITSLQRLKNLLAWIIMRMVIEIFMDQPQLVTENLGTVILIGTLCVGLQLLFPLIK
uniref:ABC transmembrane type-1 domain-containing protein n=1 Tax=Tetranychus urticae TaxID=32264 RepID=T1KQL5_TETUR